MPHILNIDDDAALARLFAKAAERHGYSVEHATTIADGLRAVASGEIDLVVLDHDLKTETGLDFFTRAAGTALPPVVYVTGNIETSVAVAALKAGAADYVIKSVADHFFDLLFSSIEQALERDRLAREKAQAELEVRAARDRAELMLREVNHRIANSLSLVAATVTMQAASMKDPAALEALASVQARIRAVAGVHRRLYTSTDLASVPLHDYLRGLVEELTSSIGEPGSHRITLKADDYLCSPDTAVAVGMIVTELITNVFKYAYPSGESGEARVILSVAPLSVELAVEDDGAGFDAAKAPGGTGLGTKIIRAMSQSIGATISHDETVKGTSVRLRFPAAA